MIYDHILRNIEGEGISRYSQGVDALDQGLSIGGGVCRALVILWLKAQKENTDFWKYINNTDEEKDPLISTLFNAIDLQIEYSNTFKGRWVIDSGTQTALERAGMKLKIEDVRASSDYGFADNRQVDNIANQVLSASSRFYILSAQGIYPVPQNAPPGTEPKTDGHSFGIWRPYSVIGKSSDIHVFDPNVGEFKVSGVDNLKTLLQELIYTAYVPNNIQLNSNYVLWSFYYNP